MYVVSWLSGREGRQFMVTGGVLGSLSWWSSLHSELSNSIAVVLFF